MKKLLLLVAIITTGIANAQATTGNTFTDNFNNAFRNGAAAASASAAYLSAVAAETQARGWDSNIDGWNWDKNIIIPKVITYFSQDSISTEGINEFYDEIDITVVDGATIAEVRGSSGNLYKFDIKIFGNKLKMTPLWISYGKSISENRARVGKRKMKKKDYRFLDSASHILINALRQ